MSLDPVVRPLRCEGLWVKSSGRYDDLAAAWCSNAARRWTDTRHAPNAEGLGGATPLTVAQGCRSATSIRPSPSPQVNLGTTGVPLNSQPSESKGSTYSRQHQPGPTPATSGPPKPHTNNPRSPLPPLQRTSRRVDERAEIRTEPPSLTWDRQRVCPF